MNAIMSYEHSTPLAEAKKLALATQTNSLLGRSAVIAVFLGTTASLFASHGTASRTLFESGALSSTNAYPADELVDEKALATELVRVFTDIATRQVEMDDVARSVLYKRMRELYRR